MTYPGLTLPQAQPATTGWRHADWIDVRGGGPATDGTVTLELDQLGPEEMWLIDHMVIDCPGSPAAQLRLYDSQVHPRQLLDGSSTGTFDVADWPTGLRLGPSRRLVAQWTGCTDGTVATLTLQARIYRRA